MRFILTNIYTVFILILIGLTSCEQDEYYIDPYLEFEIVCSDSIAPANVAFHNKSLHLEHFEWDFGDETTSHEMSPNHSYNSAGEYTITLIAWNDREQLTIQKTIYLSKAYQYQITNNSQFLLYNLTAYSVDGSKQCEYIDHGKLNAYESSEKCETGSKNLYVSFEDLEGRKYKTAFPFRLSDNIINELIIDKYTLVVTES